MKRIIFLLTCFFAGASNATVLTFDSTGTLSDDTYATFQGTADTYTQNGYTLTVGGGDHLDTMNSNGLYWHDGPLNQNIDNFAYLTFSGGLFDLDSFQLNITGGDLITNLGSLTTYSSGVHAVNLTGLTWAAFSPTESFAKGVLNGDIYLDNVDVSASSVPEPSVIALLGLGFAGLGFTRKMKRK